MNVPPANVEGHIATLMEKHRKLDMEIKAQSQRSTGDHVRITALKREKLRLKDEISRLSPGSDSSSRS